MVTDSLQLELPRTIDATERAAIAYCLGLLSALIFELPARDATRSRAASMLAIAAKGAGVQLDPAALERIEELTGESRRRRRPVRE